MKLATRTRQLIIAGLIAMPVVFVFIDPATAKELALLSSGGFFALLRGDVE